MKYIITEKQEEVIKVLRRIDGDWSWIQEIVDEGVDNDDPCDFNDVEIYLDRVCRDSATTYLFTYGYNWGNKTFSILSSYIQNLIKENMSHDIIEYWEEKREECDEQND